MGMKTEPITLRVARNLYKARDYLKANYVSRVIEYIRLNSEHRTLSKATNTELNDPKINNLSYFSSEVVGDFATIVPLLVGAANDSLLMKLMGGSIALFFQLYLTHTFKKYKKMLSGEEFERMKESSEPYYNAMIK